MSHGELSPRTSSPRAGPQLSHLSGSHRVISVIPTDRRRISHGLHPGSTIGSSHEPNLHASALAQTWRLLRVKIGSKTPSNTLQIASNIFKSEYQNLNQVSSGFKDDSERRCLKNHTGIKSWTPHRTDSFCKYLAVSLRTKFCARTMTCADQNTKSLTIFGL